MLTALSGEKFILDSWPVNRYYPYRLYKYNSLDSDQTENFIFYLGDNSQKVQTESLESLLKALGVDFGKTDLGHYCLLYNIKGTIYPRIYYGPKPEYLSEIFLAQITETPDYLVLVFRNRPLGENLAFKLNVEVPGFCHTWKYFSIKETEVILRIPRPIEEAFYLKYYLEYQGIEISDSRRLLAYKQSLSEEKRKRHDLSLIYLQGVGPTINCNNQKMKILEKDFRFHLTRKPMSGEIIQINLYSPFEFGHLHWYGNYSQEEDIFINNVKVKSIKINDGFNIIRLESKLFSAEKIQPLVHIKFKYDLTFSFSPDWKTAAFLFKIEIKRYLSRNSFFPQFTFEQGLILTGN